MKFYDFCLLSENISVIKKRNQIIDILKETFLKLNTEELIIFIELSLGKFEDFSKKNLNLGISTIFDAIKELFLNNIPENINVEDFGEWIKEIFIFNNKNEPSNYNLIDIYKEIESYKNLKGEGVKRLRVEKLNKTFKNLSSIEAKYFTKIIIGEIRGGLKEGLFKKALSKFYNIDEKKLNELFLKSGSFRKFINSLKKGEFKIEVFKPIPMMLAQKVDSIDEIYDVLKNFSLEYKYDGVRVQIHKRRDEVKIFSRNLLDLTENLEDLTDKVKENFNEFNEIILEGELLGFTEYGKNLSFQDLMSVIFRKEKLKKINLNVFLFDILYLNGEDLTNFPLYKRVEILDKVKRDFNRTKYLIPKDKVEAQKFYENSLKEGYEGVMAKDLNGIYQSGRRGKLWLKLKKVETLDLVILKAFWGYGRRVNWLSDYMLYCLSKDKRKFLPLGKTFKGLSDKEFVEITKRLLEIKEKEIDGGILVKPKIVVEVGFEDIQKSIKYESGYALRFARILRFREDKTCFDVNTIEDIEEIYNKLHKVKWYNKFMKSGEFLKDRGLRFFKNGVELFNRGEYDLSAFNIEQAVQLILKYAIWKKLGDFEKTYEVSKLLNDYKDLIDEKAKVDEFIKKYERTINDLEVAYIESRYLPSQFFKEQIEEMINFFEELTDLIKIEWDILIYF